MSRTIDFAVLTKSAKHHELCIAGIDWNTGEFIRIVTLDKDTDGAVPKDKFHYENGKEIACFDLIKISVSTHDGNELQPENLIWDQSKKIEFIKKVDLHEVLEKHPAELHDSIFGNIYSCAYRQTLEKIKKSLMLVKVTHFKTYSLKVEYEEGTRLKTKAMFDYNGEHYQDISVTDPKYFGDEYEYDNVYIIISIGNEFHDKYYKWIAAIYDSSLIVQNSLKNNMENPSGIRIGSGINMTTIVRYINFCLSQNGKSKISASHMIDILVDKNILYKNGKKSYITATGFNCGAFYDDALTKDGKPYRGVFYNKNMQSVILNNVDGLTIMDKKLILQCDDAFKKLVDSFYKK